MSWKIAKVEADKLYADLRAKYNPGMIRMIIRALDRELKREDKANRAQEPIGGTSYTSPTTPNEPS